MDDAEFEKVYGRWARRTPQDAARLFDGYPGVWWIAGGWALEAFTGVTRHHEDLDPSVLRADLPALRRHLDGHLHVWSASSGALKPILPGDRPEAAADDVLMPGSGQVWTRPDAEHPWEFDILLSPGTRDQWRYKRDESVRMPMADALWERDGIRYLQPEIQLLYKAKGLRAKDQIDFDATLPFLDARRRAWLSDALEQTLPGHPWLGPLQPANV
ncbi:hypothetical protein [Microbacterium sp. H1-D42]|uniref:hypothetical protein n=1 Tax=Microbacterium sp. H1-D42 TaxID=2925844 RepID=UPI001F53C669|nr:hypothetical protein [Microbacterium sp. H1-D42]UNK71568.1 hypothetical protein MNR00_03670 [Microbacterium sp. H1-D42]